MIRKSVLVATIAALLAPAVADALGLGNIQVDSGLNEPLQARIPLRGATPGELQEVNVALGDDAQFQRAGLERVFVLSKLRFKVVETSADVGYIEVTTQQPVAEPFLNFLVDVSWSRGRVLREYTLLLDPPVYGAAITSATQQRMRTVDTLPETRAPAASPAPAPTPSPPPTAAPRPAPRAAAAAPRYSGDSYGPVREGETLWSIADRVRPGGASIQSMMLALLEANPEAFNIDNINALRTGAVLRIPPASELLADKTAALAEVASQHALWEEYRQSLSGAVTAQPGGARPVGASAAPGAPAPAPAAPTGGGAGSTKLELVGAGRAGAGTGAGSQAALTSLRDELSVAQEEADAAKLQNEELRSRLGDAEGLVDDLKRLVELKEEQLADLQNQLARAEEAKVEPPAAPPPPMVEAPAAAAQPDPAPAAPAEPAKSKRAPPPPPPPAPTSFLDEINAMLPVPLWSVLGGLGALIVGLGGLSWARRRKRAAQDEAGVADEEPTRGSMIDQYARTELPEEDDEDATQMPAAGAAVAAVAAGAATALDDDEDRTQLAAPAGAPASPAEPQDEDPLAEVNVYLAYERFDQAEQLVRDAVSRFPDRNDYRLKLLEVFYAAKNLEAFEAAAGELQTAVGEDDPLMQQAREWWGELGAGRALLAPAGSGPDTARTPPGATDESDVFDVTTGADAGDETGVDFDLGFEGAGEAASGSGLDFDLGGDESAAEGEGGGLDFDLGDLGSDAAEPRPAAGESSETGLDFDLDAGEAPAAEAAVESGGTGLDFDLDAGEAPAGETAVESGETGLDFDLADFGEAEQAPPAGDGETVPERIGGADEDMDFDLTGLDDGSGASEEERGDGGGGALEFEADAAAPQESTARQDAAGEESGLDFDLSDTKTLGEDALARVKDDVSAEDAAVPAADAAGEESGLDFDLGDTTALAASADEGADDETQVSDEGSLDFDLGDTTALSGADEGTGDETKVSADESLDFDLGDTGEGAEQAAGAESELDFDLGDIEESATEAPRQPSGEAEPADEAALDFDLGDTGDAATGAAVEETPGDEAALDFDLGDTGDAATGAAVEEKPGDESALDFDLGDTGDAATGAAVEEKPGDESALDFDLGDTGDAATGAAVEEKPGDEIELDFDLGDTGAGEADAGDVLAGGEPEEDALDFDLDDTGTLQADAADARGAEEGEDLDFTLDAGDDGDATRLEDPFAEAGGDEPLALDMELDAGEEPLLPEGDDEDLSLSLDLDAGEEDLRIDPDAATEVSEEAYRDARTEVDSGSGLDLDFSLDADDATTAGGAGTEESSPDLQTVKLSPEEANALGAAQLGVQEAGAEDDDFGVDTEFRDIFGPGASDGQESDASSLDFDLGTSLDDEPGAVEGDDLESTQTMLRDVPLVDGSDDDEEEDHTLVLGRGSGEVDELQTKLDLAQAYMDMGDVEGARNLLGEVMAEGSDAQQGQAREMLGKLG